jgi:long-chain acyl-CoA synthetase
VVLLSRENILSDAAAIAGRGALDGSCVSASLVTPSHLYGLQTGFVVPALTSGSTVIVDAAGPRASTRALVAELGRSGATHVFGVPLAYYLLKRTGGVRAICNHVRMFSSGGYSLPGVLAESFRETTGRAIYEGYGLTEASPTCTWFEQGEENALGSVGRALSCCEIRVVAESGAVVGAGVTGAVQVRGSNVSATHYGARPSVPPLCQDGWLCTGDRGYLDSCGRLYLVGRDKDMLKVGGYSVYPAEVSRLVERHPRVYSAQVFADGVSVTGDSLAARIVAEPRDRGDIMAWMRAKMSYYKVPGRVDWSAP